MPVMEMDEMVCVCGEVLTAEKGKGLLWEQYQEHLSRPDHQPTAEQWVEAGKRIAEAKERSEKARKASERKEWE